MTKSDPKPAPQDNPLEETSPVEPKAPLAEAMPVEIGGPNGPEPTRYGDWEQKGRCTDF